MQKQILMMAIALACSNAAFAGEVRTAPAMPGSSEAAFLQKSATGWRQIGNSRYESHVNGQVVTVAFGQAAFESDVLELNAATSQYQEMLATETDAAKRAELETNLRANERALDALLESVEQDKTAVVSYGSLNGCTDTVGVTAVFEYDMGYADILLSAANAWTAPVSIGTVTLSAKVGSFAPQTATVVFGPGMNSASVDTSRRAKPGIPLVATASILPTPGCGVTGYRNVKWTTNGGSVGAGMVPAPVYF